MELVMELRGQGNACRAACTVVRPGGCHGWPSNREPPVEDGPVATSSPAIAAVATGRGVTAADIAGGICIGRIVTGGEIVDVVTFLASPRSGATTGDAIPVGGRVPGARCTTELRP